MADIQTIIKIREHRDEIRKLISKFPIKDYLSTQYGSENEYDIKGLLSGIEAILFDISALTKSPLQFVKMSNYTERNQIVSYLNTIQTHLNTKQLPNVATTLDTLKVIIRNYNVRSTEGRHSEFMGLIDELQKKSSIFSRNLEESISIRDSSNKLKKEINGTKAELETKLEELESKIEESEVKVTNISTLVENLNSKEEEVNGISEKIGTTYEKVTEELTTSKSHTEIITNFSKRVEKREAQLDKQEQKTEEYRASLIVHKTSHDEILQEAQTLIESAKLALSYKTAESLSIAFREKYDELKNDKNNKFWIVSAGAFFVSAVLIGIWILSGTGLDTGAILGRISLIPLLIGGSWFCANQYLKHKNLMEDYAYKNVLVKSIVGFTEQLSGSSDERNKEYNYYLKSMLDEIHNHPTIKKKVSTKTDADIGEDIKSLYDEVKSMAGQIKKYTKGSD